MSSSRMPVVYLSTECRPLADDPICLGEDGLPKRSVQFGW